MSTKSEQFASEAAKTLRKLIASGGKASGSFCLAKGGKQAGIAVFLKKRDPKGTQVKNVAKIFKAEFSATQFAFGTVKLEDGKLVFRRLQGKMPIKISQDTLRKNFSKYPKPLPNLLRQALVADGEAVIASNELQNVASFDANVERQKLMKEIRSAGYTPETQKKMEDDLRALCEEEDDQTDMAGVMEQIFDDLFNKDSLEYFGRVELTTVAVDIDTLSPAELEKVLQAKIKNPRMLLYADIQNPKLDLLLSEVSNSMALMDKILELKAQRRDLLAHIKRNWLGFLRLYGKQKSVINTFLNTKVTQFDNAGDPLMAKNFRNIFNHFNEKLLQPKVDANQQLYRQITSLSQQAELQEFLDNVNDLLGMLRTNFKIQAIDNCIAAASLEETLTTKLNEIKHFAELAGE